MPDMKRETRLPGACWLSLPIAAALFTLVFCAPAIGFWRQLAASAAALALWGFAFDRAGMAALLRTRRPTTEALLIGCATATLLYAVFALGNLLVSWGIPSGHRQIQSVYVLGADVPAWRIGLILLFAVGPCE